jgi:hypothetical protein
MARKRRGSKRKQDVVVWVRLPQNVGLDDLKDLGLPEVACYGGDTCIAATTPTPDAGLIVQRSASENVRRLLRDAGLNPRVACFGGDTCIV